MYLFRRLQSILADGIFLPRITPSIDYLDILQDLDSVEFQKVNLFTLIKFFYSIAQEFPKLLSIRTNSLRNIPDPTKYLTMVMLCCFWCLAFGIYFGELLTIGYNMIGHIAIVTMVFVTWWNIRSYTKRLPTRGVNYLRAPDRSSRCDDYSDEQRAKLALLVR